MSDHLTPEQAQEQTVRAWKARTENKVTPITGADCGWCDFATKGCPWCPIYRITEETCYDNAKYMIWYRLTHSLKRRKVAADIVRLLVENGDELIATGHRILEESKK